VTAALPPDPRLDAALASTGPLDAATARALLQRGRELLDANEPGPAAQAFQRVIGHEDAATTAEAWLGYGDVLYRVDRDADAVRAWEAVTQLPETPATYRAWRQIAGARVRSGDLPGATQAYREAERRAPSQDRAEIASRLGWLAKEQGQRRAASRYFARSRGDLGPIGLAQVLVVVTVIVSVAAYLQAPASAWPRGGAFPPPGSLYALLWLDPRLVIQGQVYRLLSVVLLHSPDNLFFWVHLGFNMYALYLIGPVVESIWGSRLFAVFYVLTGIAASTTSVLLSPAPAVGASGAIFGLIGVVFAGTRVHHPVLDQRARAIVPQLGFLIVLNLVLGFSIGGIDNAAHIGGLVSGLWLGFVVPPGKVPTLRSIWQHPGGQAATTSPLVIAAGILLLISAILLGLALAGVRL
jgi:membrane associated rhomboid family serine protease